MISKLANVLTVANQDNLMVGELYCVPPQSESHTHVHLTILSLPILPSSLPASPQRPRPMTSAPPSPGLTWTLCLYNSFMEHGGVLCRHAGPWAGSTPPSVLLESICKSSSIIVFALFVSSLFSLTVVSVLLVMCRPIPPLVTSCPQNQFTGSKMCISYATTPKNKDANALASASPCGVFVCLQSLIHSLHIKIFY